MRGSSSRANRASTRSSSRSGPAAPRPRGCSSGSGANTSAPSMPPRAARSRPPATAPVQGCWPWAPPMRGTPLHSRTTAAADPPPTGGSSPTSSLSPAGWSQAAPIPGLVSAVPAQRRRISAVWPRSSWSATPPTHPHRWPTTSRPTPSTAARAGRTTNGAAASRCCPPLVCPRCCPRSTVSHTWPATAPSRGSGTESASLRGPARSATSTTSASPSGASSRSTSSPPSTSRSFTCGAG